MRTSRAGVFVAALVGFALATAAAPAPPTVPASASAPTLASSTVPASASAPASPTSGLPYVALGDSYAAGLGLPDPSGLPVPDCGQSSDDYPHQVAEALGMTLRDVSCSGAVTTDITTNRQFDALPQIDALGHATRVVTVTIGGNDAGLFASASKCIALSADGPILSGSNVPDCKAELDAGGDDQLGKTIADTVASNLSTAFAAIKAKAPNARVFVVGYPAVFPDAAHTPAEGCFRPVLTAQSFLGTFPSNGFPFTTADIPFLYGVQVKLDAAMAAASKEAGFTYVPMLADSVANSGCADASVSYLEGVTLESDSSISNITLKTGALHPNVLGAHYLAQRTTSAIRASFAALPAPSAASPAVVLLDQAPWLWLILWAVLLVAAAIAVALVLRRRSEGPEQQRRR